MGMTAQQAQADRAAYARTHPGWYELRYYGPPAPQHFADAVAERQRVLNAETREEFWARHEAAGTTYGLKPYPPLKKVKRGPSKEVLALRARVAELEAMHVASAPVDVWALQARVAELEGMLAAVESALVA